MSRKDDVFYSLRNVINGNILSSRLNGVNGLYGGKEKEVVRKRNWKLSQFQISSKDTLDYFVSGGLDKNKTTLWHETWSMGFEEVWVKKDEVDLLYAALAMATLSHFCAWDKQKCLFGAFLFNKDPELFHCIDFTSSSKLPEKILKKESLGKEFLMFLDSFGVLSYGNREFKYINNRSISIVKNRTFFAFAEIELISRKRSEITTEFRKVFNATH